MSPCLKCPMSARRCAGPCPCTIDMVDISVHAARNYCPEGRFGGPRPDDWHLAGRAPMPIPPDHDPTQERRRGGCCDPPRSE
jgi:Fe-S oxidoreductase